MKVGILQIGVGRSGSELIKRISQKHVRDDLDVVKIEPLEQHGFYGWLVRSFIPGFEVPVRRVNLRRYEMVYLLVPKWGYNCPPVNGFLNSHDLRGTRLALIITYTKGDVSGYSTRLVRKVKEKGANLIGSIALKRGEISSEGLERIDELLERVSQHRSIGPNSFHEHEIVFIGMVNVNRHNYLQGIVDVWRCRQCKKLFCEDRRFGEGLEPRVGFEEIPDGQQWAILTCTDIKGVFMTSLPVKPGKKIEHTCTNGEKHVFNVKDDWSIDSSEGKTAHGIYMVKDYLNKVIEAGYYKLRMLK